ncbi:MAG: hypothetical protein OEX04_12245 [Acidimicrobiia bacterium]|nr:hypothetical protein [Acidimicrobiia bacterium]MDH4308237.1 hypothetical protein [Acidimicrobiia bacterium]MDH5293865.1 hypothetical protein [Acidimicrobiia bacterium]
MLSSIHPLGERARSNRWATTITAFALGSLVGGLALTAVASQVGVLVGFRVASPWVLIPLAVAAIADLIGIPVTSPHRQVNERWIGTYRGWVYGFGFGIQLGIGFATYVVTWTLPGLVATLVLAGQPGLGLAAGVAFGLGRAVPLVAAGWIDRPERLNRFHMKVADLGRIARFVNAAAVVVVAGLAMGTS